LAQLQLDSGMSDTALNAAAEEVKTLGGCCKDSDNVLEKINSVHEKLSKEGATLCSCSDVSTTVCSLPTTVCSPALLLGHALVNSDHRMELVGGLLGLTPKQPGPCFCGSNSHAVAKCSFL